MSYTTFHMSLVSPAPSETLTIDTAAVNTSSTLTISIAVTNTGAIFAGTETVMAYVRPLNRTNPGGSKLLPLQRRLCGFVKLGPIAPGGSENGNILLRAAELAMADATGSSSWLPGDNAIILSRGGIGQPEITLPLTITGKRRVIWTLPLGI